jgi:hypothetical protein
MSQSGSCPYSKAQSQTFTPYGQKSDWKGPLQYPYITPKQNLQAYTPYVPWGRRMQPPKMIKAQAPLPTQKYPCTCRDKNNRVPVVPTASPGCNRKIDYMAHIFG